MWDQVGRLTFLGIYCARWNLLKSTWALMQPSAPLVLLPGFDSFPKLNHFSLFVFFTLPFLLSADSNLIRWKDCTIKIRRVRERSDVSYVSSFTAHLNLLFDSAPAGGFFGYRTPRF